MLINLLDDDSENLLLNNTFCVIGTGIAGYEVARILSLNPSNRVVMLESGGVHFNADYQSVNQHVESGKTTRATSNYNKSDPDSTLSRVRQLGGTINIWSGKWKPLEHHDFEQKNWNSLLRWPITYDELLPFYNSVIEEYGLYESGYNNLFETAEANSLKFTKFYQGINPLRLDNRLKDLSNRPNVNIFYNASVSNFITDESGTIIKVLVKTSDQKTYAVCASNYILATGGIENARILLNTQTIADKLPALGRYYMDHPTGEITTVAPYAKFFDQHYPNSSTSDFDFKKDFCLKNEVLNEFCLPHHAAAVYPTGLNLAFYQDNLKNGYEKGLEQIKRSIYKLINKQLKITVHIEQLPSYNSKVFIADQTDNLGIKKAGLNWSFTNEEQEKLLKYLLILKEKISGQYGCELIYDESNIDLYKMNDANHHMGTTRMGISNLDSVVDSDCKVHGVKNLFIAGSSVFCTSGNANPTFTLTALASRLGIHLNKTDQY